MNHQPATLERVREKSAFEDRHPIPPNLSHLHDPYVLDQLGEKLGLILMKKFSRNQSKEASYGRIPMLSVPTTRGYDFLKTDQIISLQADGSYTNLSLKDGNQILLSKNLGTIRKMLCETCFLQPNRSWVVNLNEITSIELDVKNLVTSNGIRVPIARDRLSHVKEILGI